MAYRLIISRNVERQIDNLIDYLVNELKNPGAAKSVLEDINSAYSSLTVNAGVFAFCSDPILRSSGYRKYVLVDHDYLIIYRVEGADVRISGIFHTLENYAEKL